MPFSSPQRSSRYYGVSLYVSSTEHPGPNDLLDMTCTLTDNSLTWTEVELDAAAQAVVDFLATSDFLTVGAAGRSVQENTDLTVTP